MEFLNIGLPELLFILLLAVVLIGPKDLVKFSRAAGKFLYRLFRSEAWVAVRDTSREIQDFPARMVREAGLDETLRGIKPSDSEPTAPAADSEHSIWPPQAVPPAAPEGIPPTGGDEAGTLPPAGNG